MKLILVAALSLLLTLGCTKKKDASNAEMRRPQGADGTRRPISPPTEEQRKALTDCVRGKGQRMPERPNFTEAQRASMVECKTENRDSGLDGFQKCVKKAGIVLPAPPTPELRKAVMECRQEVMSPR